MIEGPMEAALFIFVVVVLGIAVVFGYLGLAAGDTRPSRHECQWETLAATPLPPFPFQHAQTAVLKRCDGCGELQTMNLTGQWTLTQLTSAAGLVDADGTAAAEEGTR
ncbi:hypothetical protein [Streptosporangium lutulentum]|uniref:Uncharacterized protein n=1 Tax=Streptosporangium lutulentum TaxID=1461250 RepID=A0ABT9Q986_9ACTN|nr:hypothetical protein [Streptosporangium lutulentum]MDP9843310.1 hypothetical protein [Streptosporangium lutulentum]